MKEFFAQIPLVCLITEGVLTAENFPAKSAEVLNTIRRAAEANIALVQIREKNLPAKLIYELTARAVEITRGARTKILVNDRADIALAARANGVHLTARSLPAEIIRHHFPKDFIVGVSAHSLAEANAAQIQNADFAAFSPIFKTPSKDKFGHPQGLEKLRDVCEKLKPFPIIALGGIDENNFKTVLENGAAGYAAIRFLNELFHRRTAEEAREILQSEHF